MNLYESKLKYTKQSEDWQISTINAMCQRWLSQLAVLSIRTFTNNNLLPLFCSDGNNCYLQSAEIGLPNYFGTMYTK